MRQKDNLFFVVITSYSIHYTKLYDKLFQSGYRANFYAKAIVDFVPQASVQSALKKVGLDSDSIVNTVLQELNINGSKA